MELGDLWKVPVCPTENVNRNLFIIRYISSIGVSTTQKEVCVCLQLVYTYDALTRITDLVLPLYQLYCSICFVFDG
jgi:hypothetical protein